MSTRHQQTEQDDRREREEMFSIAPELLAGGALPRRGDGSPYRAEADAAQPRRRDEDGRAR